MRKQVLLAGIVLIAFFTQANAYKTSVFKADTIVGSKVITNEYAGSAYRKRGKEYFVIINKDTSDFKYFFSEDKEDANIDLEIGDHKLIPEKKTLMLKS